MAKEKKAKLTKEEKERLAFEKERKRWQQREAQTRDRKSVKVDATAGVAKLSALLLVLAILLGLGYTYGKNYGIPTRFLSAAKVGGKSVTASEYAFYVYTAYRGALSQAEQYTQMLGMNLMGLDSTTSPWTQTAPDQTKWPTYLKNNTDKQLLSQLSLSQEAEKAGVTLSDENRETVEAQIKDMETQAKANSMSLNAYLRLNYTAGVTAARYEKLITREILVEQFRTQKNEEFSKNYDDATLQKTYDADPAAYNAVTLRVFSFPLETLTANEGESEDALKARQKDADDTAEDKADAFYAKVTDEAAFIAAANAAKADTADYDAATATLQAAVGKSDISGAVGEEGASWAFESARKQGEKTLLKTNDAYHILYLVQSAFAANTVDYIGFQVAADTDESGQPTEAGTQTAQKTAKKLLDDFKADGGSEDAFAKLAADNGATAAEGSDEKPGYVTHTDPHDAASSQQAAWLSDTARKKGDTAAFVSDAGVTILFFAGENKDEPIWRENLRQERVEQDFEDYAAALIDKENGQYAVKNLNPGMYFAMKTAQRMIEDFVTNYNNTDYAY
jgi:hypothetical protein